MSDEARSGASCIRVTVLTGRKGHATAKVVGETGAESLLHSLYDPLKEARQHVPESISHETVVFLGTGLGYHIPPTLLRHRQIKRVIIVERYAELAKMAAALVTDPAITTCTITPSDASSSPYPEIPEDIDAGKLTIISHPPSIHANPKWYSRYHALLAASGSERKRQRDHAGAGFSRPLTILVLYGAYYCQAECIRGFEELGHNVVTLDYRERDLVDSFHEILRKNRPDLVFTVNMRGLDNRGVMAGILSGMGIPLALWFVDSPEFILYGETLPSPDGCMVFVWDRGYLSAVKDLGYEARYLPLAADSSLARAARADRFQSEVSFVGNSLCSGFLNRLAVKFPRNASTSGIAEQAVSALLDRRGGQLDKLEEILSTGNIPLSGRDEMLFFRAFILHSATTRYRTALLGRLLPLGPTFFGDPAGWEKVFGKGISTHPDVNYFSETPSVYASSAVNFNATSFQMPQAVNQRVFDVPLSGGFLLTDRQDDLFELFGSDEVAVYEGVEDVAEKAKFYLAHPAVRASIAGRARARVLKQHTYRHRMAGMLAGMGL